MSRYKKHKKTKPLTDDDFKNIYNPTRDIKNILKDLEIAYSITILYCSIVGSRAYGLEKKDSDYNIRFIYKKNMNSYLTLEKKTDQITYHEYEYNFIGWDIDKALKQHYKSNITLYEWLNSQKKIINDETIKFHTLIDFDKNTLQYAYTSLAEKNFTKARTDVPYKITDKQYKQYIYSIRYILSWNILHYDKEYPPLNINELLNKNKNIPKDIEKYIKTLIKLYKKQELEKIGFIEISNINAWIYNSIKIMKNTIPLHPPQRKNIMYHELKFRELIT